MQQAYTLKAFLYTKYRNSLIVLVLLLATSWAANAQLTINVGSSYGSTTGQIDFTVEDFVDIAGLQFTIKWDSSLVAYDSVSNFAALPGAGTPFNFGTTFLSDGKLLFLWTSNNGLGETLPDGTALFSLHLHLNGPGSSPIDITGDPLIIEVVQFSNNQLTEIPLIVNPGQITATGALVQGNVFIDDIEDCTYDGSETGLEGWQVHLQGASDFYSTTNSLGEYRAFVDTGDYQLSVIPPNLYWEACQSYSLSLDENDDITQDIPVQETVSCPYMTVDVSAPFLRRCFSNYYTVNYCNQGTATAIGASVEVELDPFFNFVNASLPFTINAGGLYVFDVGDLDAGQCGSFQFEVILDCASTVIGQTHCVEANVYPDTVCIPPPSSNWSGASLEVEGRCEGQEVIFEVHNTGTGNMNGATQYIVIEDVIMRAPINFTLGSGQTLGPIAFPANGTTYRFEVNQVPNHPGNSQPSATVEGCGTDGNGNFSIGFVNQFPHDDADAAVSIDCQQSRGSFDPNDKQGFPVGYGDEHYIEANTDIEYMIRFQNTGTDTAFNVVILDTLSNDLDVSSLQAGSSSHPYTLEISGEGQPILKFSFNNIMLADSNINEPLSHGFVKFKLAQHLDLPDGTVITNDAAIYFDFNEPVITNETFHTIGEEFITVNVQRIFLPDMQVNVFPNPTAGAATFELQGRSFRQLQFKLYDMAGRQLRNEMHDSSTFSFDATGLGYGMYLYKIEGDGQLIGSGKLVVGNR